MLTRHGPEGQSLDKNAHFWGTKVLVRGDLRQVRCGKSQVIRKALCSAALASLDKCFEVHERSLVSAKPFCQVFAYSVDTKQTGGMEIVEIRRARLALWFKDLAMPEEEKSYLSQLKNGKASFGEKAARRLEKTYHMPAMYLDTPIDADVPANDGDAWSGLSAQRRELIQRIASDDVPDGMIAALRGVLEQAQPAQARAAPKMPASAVYGGPPRSRDTVKKAARTGKKN